MAELTMDTLVSLCKQRGFVFPGSEIYGGLANAWDYGPLGVELKNNIAQEWWRFFVRSRQDMVGIDAAVLMNPKVWESSGHVANFNDAQVDCKSCKSRLRADHLIENALEGVKVEGLSLEDLDKLILQNKIACPKCGEHNFTECRVFNLLFRTFIGPVSKDAETVYLRGELAQSMFTNFKNVLNTSRKKVPFGIAQIGKVFRNEITPGNFIFRTLEFDLMEFEYFIHPSTWETTFEYWLAEMKRWVEHIGIDTKRTRVREHTQDELSHYSKRTVDIEFETPFGWKELFGLAYRTDFDLKNHMEKSGEDLQYFDPFTNEKFIPHVVEPTFGLTRTFLMILLSSYHEEQLAGKEGEDSSRVVLKLNPRIAPYKTAILPLSNKLTEQAQKVWALVKDTYNSDFDTSGSIGKRYRRQDEIGTPYCITVDFETANDNKVTIRERDSMKQDRIAIDQVATYLKEHLGF
ncbi:MAG: glycine--tRNA ligase [Candidatus Abawacabacteria bacterium]|nr:glycine--tRNA ligase [Candidatus Abawacabacteria bacterium]